MTRAKSKCQRKNIFYSQAYTLTLGPSHAFIVIMDLVPAPPPATDGTRKFGLPATGRARQGNVRSAEMLGMHPLQQLVNSGKLARTVHEIHDNALLLLLLL